MKQSILSKFSNQELEELAKEKTLKEIGQMCGLNYQAVSDYFKKNGIKYQRLYKNRYEINHHYFDEIDTEEKAYLLGFFVADGCVKKVQYKHKFSYRMSLDNTIKDAEIMQVFHDRICPQTKMHWKHIGENTNPQYTVQWNSDHMGEVLINKYKITCRKTHDKDFKLPDDAVPEHLWRHFIRGFMDGDGHVSWRILQFVFTSYPFLLQIMNTFRNFNYKILTIKGKTLTYWRVVLPFSEKKREAIKRFLYDDATIYLKRKLDSLNTEISWSLNDRVLEIVEHRAE